MREHPPASMNSYLACEIREVGSIALVISETARRNGPRSTELNLISGSGFGLLDLGHKLRTDDVVEALDPLMEADPKASFEDAPGFRALLDSSGVFVAGSIVAKGIDRQPRA